MGVQRFGSRKLLIPLGPVANPAPLATAQIHLND